MLFRSDRGFVILNTYSVNYLLVSSINLSSCFLAAPLLMISLAFSIPSFIVIPSEARYIAAPALRRTTSVLGPSAPSRISLAICALTAGSPPTRSSFLHLVNPNSSGLIVYVLNSSPLNSHTLYQH